MKEEIERELETPREAYLSTDWGIANDGKLVLGYENTKSIGALENLKSKFDQFYTDEVAFVVIKELKKSKYFGLRLTNLDESKTIMIPSDLPFKYFSDFVKYLGNSTRLTLQLKCTGGEIDVNPTFTIKVENLIDTSN